MTHPLLHSGRGRQSPITNIHLGNLLPAAVNRPL
jgi:hypothetical protein